MSEYTYKMACHNGKMRDYYRITDLLGEGAYGEVRKCIYKEEELDKGSSYKQYRAVKILKKALMLEYDMELF